MGWIVWGAIVGWFLFLQVSARQHLIELTSLSMDEVRQVFGEQFGGRLWDTAAGGGRWTAQPKLRARPPTFSIDVGPSDGGGTEVEIWISHYETYAGAMFHSLLAWRKKRAFLRSLAERAESLHGARGSEPGL